MIAWFCLNPNLTSTQGWVWQKNDSANPTHTNSMSAISQLLLTRFWWNFKGRFLWTFRTDSTCQGDICPRNICPRDICPYQEYISFNWPDFDNFKDRFLGTSRTDSNCQGDICPCNICPRDICPYQEYLSFNWPDFDETLKIASWEHLEQIPTVMVTFVQATFVYIRNISALTDPILMKL